MVGLKAAIQKFFPFLSLLNSTLKGTKSSFLTAETDFILV